MPVAIPTPPKRTLTATAASPCRFMEEQVQWDAEMGGLVRWRGAFAMPSWEGVEETEQDYVVEGSVRRLDILARRYYANEELWWVIAARNGLDLPDAQLYDGQRLKIPARAWVERRLLPQGR